MDAYRAVQIHPLDRPKQGLAWDLGAGIEFFLDNRLSMGLASSPYILTRVSNFIVRCAGQIGVLRLVNYLDDFAIINTSQSECANDQLILIRLLRRLGSFISYSKLISHRHCARFLGIEIDSVNLQMRLPIDKLKKIENFWNILFLRERQQRKSCKDWPDT